MNSSFITLRPDVNNKKSVLDKVYGNSALSEMGPIMYPFTPHKHLWTPLKCKIFKNIMKNGTLCLDNLKTNQRSY